MSSLKNLRVKIYADGAELAGIVEMAKNPMINGFTTNPTPMRKAGISDYKAFSQSVVKAVPDRGCEVGLSDHTMGVGVSVASVALGATVVETHFTLDRSEGGVDATFSMEPSEVAQLVVETERAWQALGQISYGASGAEKKSIQFRRSLCIVKDLQVGDALTRDNVRAIRPGYGLPTKYMDELIGWTGRTAVQRGIALKWDLQS